MTTTLHFDTARPLLALKFFDTQDQGLIGLLLVAIALGALVLLLSVLLGAARGASENAAAAPTMGSVVVFVLVLFAVFAVFVVRAPVG
jgi:uncharacterized membrane-anchored protein